MVPGQVHVQPERLRGSRRPAPPPLLGYGVAAACATAGLGLLCGLLPVDAPRAASVTAGLILILLGVNRFLLQRYKSKPRRRRSFERDDDA